METFFHLFHAKLANSFSDFIRFRSCLEVPLLKFVRNPMTGGVPNAGIHSRFLTCILEYHRIRLRKTVQRQVGARPRLSTFPFLRTIFSVFRWLTTEVAFLLFSESALGGPLRRSFRCRESGRGDGCADPRAAGRAASFRLVRD